MNKYDFRFLLQTKKKGVVEKRIIKEHHSFNCALYFSGISHISASDELEWDSDVVTYMLINYKVYSNDGKLIEEKTVNNKEDFVLW